MAKIGTFVVNPKAGSYCNITLDSGERIMVSHDQEASQQTRGPSRAWSPASSRRCCSSCSVATGASISSESRRSVPGFRSAGRIHRDLGGVAHVPAARQEADADAVGPRPAASRYEHPGVTVVRSRGSPDPELPPCQPPGRRERFVALIPEIRAPGSVSRDEAWANSARTDGQNVPGPPTQLTKLSAFCPGRPTLTPSKCSASLVNRS